MVEPTKEKVETKQSTMEAAKERAAKTREEREKRQKELTAKDDLLANAGNFMTSHKQATDAWVKFFEVPITMLKNHIEGAEKFQRQKRDEYARIMMTFDSTADYSSAEWEADLDLHRERLEILEALQEECKDSWKDDEDGRNDSDGSDGGSGSSDDSVRESREKRGDEEGDS